MLKSEVIDMYVKMLHNHCESIQLIFNVLDELVDKTTQWSIDDARGRFSEAGQYINDLAIDLRRSS